MAVGAGYPWLAIAGSAVVAIAAFAMKVRNGASITSSSEGEPFELQVRLGIGHDPQVVVGPALDQYAAESPVDVDCNGTSRARPRRHVSCGAP
jgi:hypothetical protein